MKKKVWQHCHLRSMFLNFFSLSFMFLLKKLVCLSLAKTLAYLTLASLVKEKVWHHCHLRSMFLNFFSLSIMFGLNKLVCLSPGKNTNAFCSEHHWQGKIVQCYFFLLMFWQKKLECLSIAKTLLLSLSKLECICQGQTIKFILSEHQWQEEKKFYNIDQKVNVIKTFFFVTDAQDNN